ncbi:MAG: hypothetical protein H6622_09430 [Halobacteriovoraceae bacterium]|nr:hypothetical protein [Halobacteriovoraceae bacterium]
MFATTPLSFADDDLIDENNSYGKQKQTAGSFPNSAYETIYNIFDGLTNAAISYMQTPKQSANISRFSKLDPSATMQDELFPNCKTPPPIDQAIDGQYCESPDAESDMTGAMQEAKLIMDQAKLFKDRYTVALAKNTGQVNTNFGVKCMYDSLENGSNNLLAQLEQNMTDLKKSIEMNKEKEEEFKREMNDLMESLNSDARKFNSSDTPLTRNLFRDPACQNVVKGGDRQKGLKNIRDGIQNGLLEKSREITSNEAKMKQDWGKQKDLIKEQIKKNGISSLSSANINKLIGNRRYGTNFVNSISKLLDERKAEMQTQYNNAFSVFKSYNFSDIPPLDNNFLTNIRRFNSENGGISKEVIEKAFIKIEVDKCVTQEQLSYGQILGSYLDTRDHGKKMYAIEMYNILCDTSRMKSGSEVTDDDLRGCVPKQGVSTYDLLNRMKSFEGKVEYNQHKYIDSNSPQKQSAYDQLLTHVRYCEKKISGLNSDGQSLFSRSKKDVIQKASQDLDQLTAEVAKFSNSLLRELDKQILCEGPTSGTVMDCSDKSLYDTKSDSFCITTAVSCAQDIGKCHAKADVLVKNELKKMYNKSRTINNKYKLFHEMQNKMVADQQARAELLGKKLQQSYGPSFVLPKGLKIDELLPKEAQLAGGAIDFENTDGTPGGMLKLIANGDPNAMLQNGYESKMDLLMGAMQKQTDAVKAKLIAHIQEVENSIDENKSKWETIMNKCSNLVLEMKSQYNQNIKKAQDAQMKQQQAADESCIEYDFKMKDPMCDSIVGDLTENSTASAVELTQKLNSGGNFVNAYAKSAYTQKVLGCQQLKALQDGLDLPKLCDKARDDSRAVEKYLKSKAKDFLTLAGIDENKVPDILKQLNSGKIEHVSDVTKIIQHYDSDLAKENDQLPQQLFSYAQILQSKKGISDNIHYFIKAKNKVDKLIDVEVKSSITDEKNKESSSTKSFSTEEKTSLLTDIKEQMGISGELNSKIDELIKLTSEKDELSANIKTLIEKREEHKKANKDRKELMDKINTDLTAINTKLGSSTPKLDISSLPSEPDKMSTFLDKLTNTAPGNTPPNKDAIDKLKNELDEKNKAVDEAKKVAEKVAEKVDPSNSSSLSDSTQVIESTLGKIKDAKQAEITKLEEELKNNGGGKGKDFCGQLRNEAIASSINYCKSEAYDSSCILIDQPKKFKEGYIDLLPNSKVINDNMQIFINANGGINATLAGLGENPPPCKALSYLNRNSAQGGAAQQLGGAIGSILQQTIESMNRGKE